MPSTHRIALVLLRRAADRHLLIRRGMSSRCAQLSREELVARLESLDGSPINPKDEAGPSTTPTPALQSRIPASVPGMRATTPPIRSGRAHTPKRFDFALHPTRHIALLVSYAGWPYAGLAIQATDPTSHTTSVEYKLLRALERTKLIQEGTGWEGCEFQRCGRTDRGVSGCGQVVNLWVRSRRRRDDGGAELGEGWREPGNQEAKEAVKSDGAGAAERRGVAATTAMSALLPHGKGKDEARPCEHAYPRMLNSVLPSTIRILAWAPVSPTFSARFSCQARHYQYAFHPRPTPSSPPLDLELMSAAAKYLVGEHDFRNLCRLDGSKQLLSHRRRVLEAYFEQGEHGMVIFNLKGTAFLYNQVRHIVAVLFLVGSGLEEPEVVRDLLDVERHPTKPVYQMGDHLPLTLWNAEYEEGQVDWRMGGYDGPWATLGLEEKRAIGGDDGYHATLEEQLEREKQEAELRAWQVGRSLVKLREVMGASDGRKREGTTFPIGGGDVRYVGKYMQVMQRPRGETPEEVNRVWREKNARKEGAGDDAE